MARLSEKLPDPVPGDFFVDRTCIDCSTCPEIIPEVFEEGNGFSFVKAQPATEESAFRSAMALVACPTGSIGSQSKRHVKEAVHSFPEPIDGDVLFCGYTSEKSFGAWSTRSRRDPLCSESRGCTGSRADGLERSARGALE